MAEMFPKSSCACGVTTSTSGPMTKADHLIVRTLRPHDEEAFLELRAAIVNDGTAFAKDYQPGIAWPDYLLVQDNARAGVGLAAGAVPYTFLVADLGGVLVGSSDIRHRLTEKLTRWGGHIGYIVDPRHRQRGYGTEILRQTLCLAVGLGIRPALTCRADNAGSRGVIHACGGVVSAQTHDGICSY
ncbi:GNAT family N-acetyltransferase [Nocardia xishanensis]|uniref:GNAT family N-acetyltransferase n=1 Tax=Nocardia xishanensis TaxID=238964 RepID=UPI0009FF3606|nr:GNAT family N-acetyltransferase [Nocardia xishanensis]